jgi:hypothetical protein
MGAMNASRRTQPYRKGQARHAGLAMKAMQKGRTGTGFNPADITRGIQKGGNAPRAMAQPVGPAKGIAAKVDPAAAVAKRSAAAVASKRTAQATAPGKSNRNFFRAKSPVEKNTTGNSRAGQSFKTVAAKGGEYHVYENGDRVFVKKPSAAATFAKRARAKGVSR